MSLEDEYDAFDEVKNFIDTDPSTFLGQVKSR